MLREQRLYYRCGIKTALLIRVNEVGSQREPCAAKKKCKLTMYLSCTLLLLLYLNFDCSNQLSAFAEDVKTIKKKFIITLEWARLLDTDLSLLAFIYVLQK